MIETNVEYLIIVRSVYKYSMYRLFSLKLDFSVLYVAVPYWKEGASNSPRKLTSHHIDHRRSFWVCITSPLESTSASCQPTHPKIHSSSHACSVVVKYLRLEDKDLRSKDNLSVNWRHIHLIDLVSAKGKTKVSWFISFHSLISH